MYIKELFIRKPIISLEIFPPKPTTPISSIYKTLEDLKDLKPDFISVTYGASGTSKSYTVELADIIKNKYHIEALAHLTCYNSSKEEINSILKQLKEKNIENILALRGDLPKNCNPQEITAYNLEHASGLVPHINSYGGFSIGCACYPEGHIECSSTLEDLKNIKSKVSQGVDFLITQLFFDNEIFYNFKEKLDILDITVPISAGIMPVINKKQIDGIHLYTMNRSDVARKIINDISNIRECFAI